MTFLATILVALGALKANKMRSLLTMLGVIIGVSSVVTMVAVSDGASQRVEEVINSLGTDTLMIFPGSSNGRTSGAGSARQFVDGDVEALRDSVPGIVAVSGQVSGGSQVVAGGKNWSTSIEGVDPDYMIIKQWDASVGRIFTEQENRVGAKVAVIGKTVAKELFGDEEAALNQRLRVDKIPVTVIGVLEEKGQSTWGRDQDDVVILPLNLARGRVLGQGAVPNAVRMLHVKIDLTMDTAQTEADIASVLQVRRKIKPGDPDNFRIRNMAEMVRSRNETQETLSQLLAITAIVSLVVGGIGIMNIMLVSVTERTKEIGLRLAVGARKKDILSQFLIEAIALSILGGLIGLGLGISLAYWMASSGDWPVMISYQVVVLALASAVMVGVFFGFYPARKASGLNPIDALRYD